MSNFQKLSSGAPRATQIQGTDIGSSSATNSQFLAANGSAGAAFRSLISGDIPNNAANTTGTAANVTGTVAVANGGTGDTSFTTYAPIAGGTTSTGALQSLSSGMSNSGYVLTSNGMSSVPTWQVSTGGGGYNPTIQTFSSGSGTYTTPANVLYIVVKIVGGGAGGGSGIGNGTQGYGGGGGGAGGTAISYISSPSSTYSYVVGAGGSPSSNGNNTTFSTITANGGNTGGSATSSVGGNGGSGGTATGGSLINITGGGGGAGGGYYPALWGGDSGVGGASSMGGGGAGNGAAQNLVGNNGQAYGSGGSGGSGGSTSFAGGSGSDGYIEVTEYYMNGAVGTATNVTGVVAVANGGTGDTSFSANQVIIGGTTSTGALAQVAGGTTGYVLTSNGTTAAPTWQAAGGGGATGSYASAYINGATWSTTSTSYADPAVASNPALTVRTSSGITLTLAGSNYPGITFTPASSSAVYQIYASVSMEGLTGVAIGAQLYDGSVVIGQSSDRDVSATAYGACVIQGFYAPGVTTPVTIRVQIYQGGGGTAYISNADLGNAIEWTILRIV